jgi:hypothetical protein
MSISIMQTYLCVLIQVLNGLLGRDNWKEAIQLPIGIIPSGSDNSLVWTVLGIRDPVSAANALAKVIWLCYVHLTYFSHDLILFRIRGPPILDIYVHLSAWLNM